MEDYLSGWSQDPFLSEEKPIHNINRNQESSGGGRHIVKI